MESKRKTRKVHKGRKATQEPKESHKPHVNQTFEELTVKNGDLIEGLLASEAWKEIAFPLLQELIASISGRLTNGIYHQGCLTKDYAGEKSMIYIGYQKALMEFNNHLQEFVRARDRVFEKKKEESLDKKAPLINPYLEELNEQETD